MLKWTTPLTQSISFPIALVLLFSGVAVFLFLWIGTWIRIRHVQRLSNWKGFFWGIRCMFLVVPVLVVWFLAFWGAGYRRLPVEKRLYFDTSAVSERETESLRALLLDDVRRDLTPVPDRDAGRAIRAIASSMTRIVAIWDGRPIELPWRVKPMPKGFLLASGTSGMCSPFTLEALVDKALPDTEFVCSAAHELGHIAGFCAEDEATFVGYISGMQADDRFARYACALNAYMDLIARLKGEDFKKAQRVLPELAKQDLAKTDEAYRKYHLAWFSGLTWRAYDRYLHTQGITEGVRNYSQGILLLVYAWRKDLVH